MTEKTKEYFWDKASAYCARAEHCEQEVKEKLYQWGCRQQDWRDEILIQLVEESYINHKRYCRAFVHDKVAYQGWGRIKIKQMLLQKGLPETLINEALNDIDEQDYQKALERALSKYPNDVIRQTRFAMQRGFEYAEIKAQGVSIP